MYSYIFLLLFLGIASFFQIIIISDLVSNCENFFKNYVYIAGDAIEVLQIGDTSDPTLAFWDGKLISTGQMGTFPLIFTQGWENVSATMKKASSMTSLFPTTSQSKPTQDHPSSIPNPISVTSSNKSSITHRERGYD